MKESVQVKATAFKGVNEISLKGEIVVFGSTHMADFPFYELVNKCSLENAIYNRSIANLTLDEAKEVLHDCVIALQPSKVFLALGESDTDDPRAIEKYSELVKRLRAALPRTDLYLICLTENSEYAEKFNKNILRLCDGGKKIEYIRFAASAEPPTLAQYKARFKQMSCFFHNKPLTTATAFAMADL